MQSEPQTVQMTEEERTYLLLREILLLMGIATFLARFSALSGRPLVSSLSLWSLVLFAVGTAAVVIPTLTRRARVARSMMWVLPLDIACIVAGSQILAEHETIFAIVVLLALMYAVACTRVQALIAAFSLSIAHTTGHIMRGLEGPNELAVIAIETLTVVMIGLIASNAVEKQREREREAIRAADDRARMNEQLERRVGELQAVAEITEVIHSSLDFDEIGPLVLEIISKVINFPALAVFVLDKEKSETLFSASVGVPHDSSMRAEGTLGLGEIEAHLTCLRVFDHGNLMVLFCAPADNIENLTDDDRLVISALASELVVAVENSRLYKLTRRLAVTDELTGMSNYRYLQQRLDDEVSRARRYGKQLSLLMMDADDFKGYNDRYGHIAGDLALAEFGAVVGSVVREVDLVARYGGEEFAVVLPETDAAGAFVVAEKIREAVASHLFPDADGVPCCALTVSIGIATFPTYAYDKEALLREADDALYRAKNGGKDRVCAPQRSSEPDSIPGDET